TEVVETSPATFSFSVKSTSVSRMTSGKVRAYRAGRPPSSEFMNGTPQRRTASAEEYFSVAAPHYNAADGPVTQRYRVDRQQWRALLARRGRYTRRAPTRRDRGTEGRERAGAGAPRRVCAA